MSRALVMNRRIEAIERTRVPAEPTHCGTCGSPRPGQVMVMCVDGKGRPRWGVCTECGLPLGANGKPISAIPIIKGKPLWPIHVYEPDRWWMLDAL